MKQPQWDKYEAAFLLEYCLKVENNELSRKEAITTVSEHLRERAKDRGFEIDEVFRNENGISMQMSAMRNCYLEKNKGLTISKLFKEVVALYKTNRNIFEKIIQEESSKVNKTIYQEFLLWLKTEKPNDTKEVIEYLSMLSMFVIKRKQLHKPIADITDADEIEHLQSIMNKPETLGIHSKKMSAKIDKALKMYLHFLHSKDKKDLSCLNCKSVLIEEKQSEDYFKVDFSSSQNYAHTKPVSCRYKGRNIPCSGWNSVFINITRAIYQDFVEVYEPYLVGFSPEECEDIKNSITDDMFALSATKSNAVVKKAADAYRKGQVKNQLYKLWSDRTGGTKSPKQWSEKYKTPILCCVDSEIYGEAKKAFSVLNSSFQSESDIKAALEFCEKATFFDKLSDDEFRDKCFMRCIVGNYARLLPDVTAIRNTLEDIDIEPYDWNDDPRIKQKIQEMASVEYNAGGSDIAISTIDSMPVEQLKEWLKTLAINDMELGVKIISNGGK